MTLLVPRHLDCAVVTALFSTNTSIAYLLSWVILQEQFVGIRIMAMILSSTGISLLAYMDGVADSRTLSGVLTASAAGECHICDLLITTVYTSDITQITFLPLAAAGSAIYKVCFKKVMGDVTFAQASTKYNI